MIFVQDDVCLHVFRGVPSEINPFFISIGRALFASMK